MGGSFDIGAVDQLALLPHLPHDELHLLLLVEKVLCRVRRVARARQHRKPVFLLDTCYDVVLED